MQLIWKKFFRFFAKASKYFGLNFHFIVNMALKKIEAYSKPHNFNILRNKMNEKAGFEILSNRCEHVTYVTVITTSMN